ncbi:MAG: hypothetical protein N3F07_02405 [Candidatus Micrarchaeota archaeon]|nr:hypothetical protein [Candidatus Micrarchaeota archaeon]
MLKGQYFSFDAVVATVIMAVAMASLMGYWYGAQQAAESRMLPLHPGAMRMAESLLSPGVPSGWQSASSLNDVKQFGIASGFSNQINRSKLDKLDYWIANNYAGSGKIMRAPAEYCILLEYTEDNLPIKRMGNCTYDSGREVAVAHRGVSIQDSSGKMRPARMRVFVWR